MGEGMVLIGRKCALWNARARSKLRRSDGDDKTRDAADDGEQHAFGESLQNDFTRRGADGETNRGLSAAVDGAGEKQIRDVGARDQKNRSANREQNLQAAAVFFLHHGDARAGGNHADVLLRQQFLDVRPHERCRIAGVVHHPRAKHAGQPRRHAVGSGAGFQAADGAKPRGDGLADERVAPLMFTSCWRGIQMSGGSLLSVSPKNPGGAMPITVKG